MGDELKVVVKAVVEADEQASAQRISSQLSAIASMINSNSTIKVGVELDQGMVQAQAQTIRRTINRAVSAHKVGINLDVNNGTVQQIRRALSKMQLDDSLTSNFEKALRKAGYQVNVISSEFEQVGDGAEKVTRALVKAQNEAGLLVDYAIQYNKKTGELDIKTAKITDNLQKQREESERLAKAQQVAQDRNLEFVSKQRQALQQVKDVYSGRTSTKPVTDGLNLGALTTHYGQISAELDRMEAQTGALSAEQKAWAKSAIADLMQMTKHYQNVEYAATQLRTKSVEQIRTEQTSNLDKYEEELRSAGLLTEKFEAQIAELRKQLSGNFDTVKFLDSFDSLKTGVGAFEAQIKSADEFYAKLTKLNAEVLDLQLALSAIDPTTNSGKYSATERSLADAQQRRDLLLQEEAAHRDVLEYSKGYSKWQEANAQNILRAAHAQGEVADKARQVDASMRTMGTTVDGIEAKFKRLLHPTNSLKTQVSDLRALMQVVMNSTDDQAKVHAYQRLEAAVTECNSALKTMATLERSSFGKETSAQFDALMKYKNDLKSAGLLTAEFERKIKSLFNALAKVEKQADMDAFKGEFADLKGEVGAFEAQIKSADKLVDELIKLENQAHQAQAALNAINPLTSPDRYSAQSGEVFRTESLVAAKKQELLEYKNIFQYSTKTAEYLRVMDANASNVHVTMGAVSDRAKQIASSMGLVSTSVSNTEDKFERLLAPTGKLVDKMEQLRRLRATLDGMAPDGDTSSLSGEQAQRYVHTYEQLQQVMRECNAEITKLAQIERNSLNAEKFVSNLEKAKAELKNVERTWSSFKHDGGLSAQFETLKKHLAGVSSPAQLTAWNAELAAFKTNVKAAGRNAQSFFDTVKTNFGKVTQWFGATSLLYETMHIFRYGVEEVTALDAAMVDLRKTTDASELSYANFYRTANQTAKDLGATTEEVIQQTAEWSRLGYTLKESSELAKNSAIFSTISEDLDLEAATDGLVSIIKAFDVEVEDTMDGIISKVNAVGNAYAVTNRDIVEVLTRSSSAMSAANNSFEETVALATAGVEITRNAEGMGNALKTVSMRIRGLSEETEAYDNEVAILMGSVADLTKAAENDFRGVSLFTDESRTTYRSTYEILQDISKVWNEIADTDQAQLAEILFGKHRAQVGMAILSNFEQAEAAMRTMAGSAGSAEAEMENASQSIEFALNRLRETWVGVAQNVFDTDIVVGFVDALSGISNIIQSVTGAFGTLGTVGLAIGTGFFAKMHSSMGGPKMTGSFTTPIYTLVVTRSELIA